MNDAGRLRLFAHSARFVGMTVAVLSIAAAVAHYVFGVPVHVRGEAGIVGVTIGLCVVGLAFALFGSGLLRVMDRDRGGERSTSQDADDELA